MALIVVLLRVYESAIRKKEFMWPDLCAVLALVRDCGVRGFERSPS
jgi:hypothetical protein